MSKLFEDLIETLAKNTHDTWALQRHQEGWNYGEQHGDKTNTCLIDYEFLPESEKIGNRNTVREIMKAILACDYMIANIITKSHGNINEASQSLQIDRATLSRKVSADNELRQLVEMIRKR